MYPKACNLRNEMRFEAATAKARNITGPLRQQHRMWRRMSRWKRWILNRSKETDSKAAVVKEESDKEFAQKAVDEKAAKAESESKKNDEKADNSETDKKHKEHNSTICTWR